MALFRNKYRVQSARLKGYNYASPAGYFVTICTKNREHFFGKIENNVVHLSEMGRTVERFWREIPEHFLNVELDQFVVMPNHVHGIIHIVEAKTAEAHIVETQHAASLQTRAKNLPLAGSLPAIVRSFKSAVTKWARANKKTFAWQSRFYDHIIRDNDALNQIRSYILHNPRNWQTDDLNQAGLSSG